MNHCIKLVSFACCILMACCANGGIDLPKGTRKGYASASLVTADPMLPPPATEGEVMVHRMIQSSLRKQFAANGMSYGGGNSDLVVSYLVLYQEPGMTARYERYYGYGRPANEIGELAHRRGILNHEGSNFFQRAGIVFDVTDSRTGKLVYRNYSKGDVVTGVSASTRAARIDAAVQQAMAGFFRD